MYALKNGAQVTVAAELQAIARFLSSRWENLESVLELAEDVAKMALRDARSWFDQHDVSTALRARADIRRQALDALEGPKSGLADYDQSMCFLQNMYFKVLLVHDAARTIDGPWDFEAKTTAVLRKLKSKYPWLAKAKPLGYAQLSKNYRDFEGQEEYCKAQWSRDAEDFEGADTSTAGASAFPHRVALAYVVYDDLCQGRSPHLVLVSSIYAHFLRIAEYLNTDTVLQALQALPMRESEPRPIWELSVTSAHPVVRALLNLSTPNMGDAATVKQAYEADKAKRREFEQLSPEAQQAIQAANAQKWTALVDSLLNSKTDPSFELEREQELKRCRDALNGTD
jgi:hypothetical protein